MKKVTIYQGGHEGQDLTLIESVPTPQEQDAAFLATWLHGKAEKTQRAYASDMRKFYDFVGKSLQDVTLADFQGFINSLVDLKPTSRNRAIATVKSALSFGVKTGWLKVNIGIVVKLPKLEDKLAERIMSEQSIAKLLALETNPRNHAILVCSIGQACVRKNCVNSNGGMS